MAKSRFKVKGLRELLETLQTLPDKVAPQGGGPIDKALYKAAKLWKEQAEDNVAGLGPGIHSTKAAQMKRGHLRLKDNIVRRRDREPERDGFYARVFVTTAPKVFWAPFVELGTEKQAAQPFLRPVIDQVGDEPIELFARTFRREVANAVERAKK